MCAPLTCFAVPPCWPLSGLQASPDPTVSPWGPSSCSSPPKGHCLVKPSQSPLPSSTVDPHGPLAHTAMAVISPHGQPSVHPAQGAEISEEQNTPGNFPKLQSPGLPPRAWDPLGLGEVAQRTPCLRSSPGSKGLLQWRSRGQDSGSFLLVGRALKPMWPGKNVLGLAEH